jgi:hypothetical protein
VGFSSSLPKLSSLSLHGGSSQSVGGGSGFAGGVSGVPIAGSSRRQLQMGSSGSPSMGRWRLSGAWLHAWPASSLHAWHERLLPSEEVTATRNERRGVQAHALTRSVLAPLPYRRSPPSAGWPRDCYVAGACLQARGWGWGCGGLGGALVRRRDGWFAGGSAVGGTIGWCSWWVQACGGCSGVHGEKSQSGITPTNNDNASCAVFLLGGFADTPSADPCYRRVLGETV